MDREEFNSTRFGPGMSALYKMDARNAKTSKHPITAVNFNEALLELKCRDGDYIWVRCESVDILPIAESKK